MNEEIFYPKLMQALLHSAFRFSAQDFTQNDIKAEHTKLSAAIRFVIEHPAIFDMMGLNVPNVDIDPIFDREGVQDKLNEVREFAALVCFKYILGQPVIVTVINADGYTNEELLAFANRFDKAILGMLEFTGKVERSTLSSTGIMLFTFFDHAAASKFIETTQAKCKKWHVLKKTFLVPWVIDVTAEKINQHSGVPLLIPQILNAKQLSKAVFHN